MSKSRLQIVAANGIIAALYFVLTVLSVPFTIGGINIRIAEMLILLCFFRRDYAIGVTVGCAISNLFFSISFIDIFVGSAATLIACLLTSYASPKLLFAGLWAVLINGVIVGVEIGLITNVNIWACIGIAAGGELIAMVVGYIVLILLKKRKAFFESIGANRNLDFKW